MRKLSILAAAGLLVSAAGLSVVVGAPAYADTQVCATFGSTTINGGKYVVQNNDWGDSTPQCIDVTATGFSIASASHNKPQNGAPGAYPSVYAGCHYGNCSAGSGLPLAVSNSQFATVQTSVSMSYPTNGSIYDASYDIWFDPTPRTNGQNTGAELMVWLNHTGSVQPVGSRVATVNLAGGTWDVWEGNSGWNVVSYVRTSAATSISFPVSTFWNDLVARGYGSNSWYLTSVQAGFEPWVNGTGLAVTNYSYSIGGSTGSAGPITGIGGKCVDVAGANPANGTKIQLYDCNGTAAQQWTVGTNGSVGALGKCMDVTAAGTANGTVVQLYDCNGTNAQKWTRSGTELINTGSGKCLDATGNSSADGTPLQIWSCGGGANQQWTIS
jgi:Glycosyl hydrolase family 12/Ricin-type beta-trefoil lectin domain